MLAQLCSDKTARSFVCVNNFYPSLYYCSVMGLLAKLFGKRESITLELSKVREFVESERAKSTALQREVPEIFAEIKH